MENKANQTVKEILAAASQGLDARSMDALADAGARVFRIRGDAIDSKDAFLDAIAGIMGFPDYFGRNWDALEDCLTDLAWIDAPAVVLVLDRTGRFAQKQPEAWRVALDVLRSAEAYWAKAGPPAFHFVLFA